VARAKVNEKYHPVFPGRMFLHWFALLLNCVSHSTIQIPEWLLRNPFLLKQLLQRFLMIGIQFNKLSLSLSILNFKPAFFVISINRESNELLSQGISIISVVITCFFSSKKSENGFEIGVWAIRRY